MWNPRLQLLCRSSCFTLSSHVRGVVSHSYFSPLPLRSTNRTSSTSHALQITSIHFFFDLIFVRRFPPTYSYFTHIFSTIPRRHYFFSRLTSKPSLFIFFRFPSYVCDSYCHYPVFPILSDLVTHYIWVFLFLQLLFVFSLCCLTSRDCFIKIPFNGTYSITQHSCCRFSLFCPVILQATSSTVHWHNESFYFVNNLPSRYYSMITPVTSFLNSKFP